MKTIVPHQLAQRLADHSELTTFEYLRTLLKISFEYATKISEDKFLQSSHIFQQLEQVTKICDNHIVTRDLSQNTATCL